MKIYFTLAWLRRFWLVVMVTAHSIQFFALRAVYWKALLIMTNILWIWKVYRNIGNVFFVFNEISIFWHVNTIFGLSSLGSLWGRLIINVMNKSQVEVCAAACLAVSPVVIGENCDTNCAEQPRTPPSVLIGQYRLWEQNVLRRIKAFLYLNPGNVAAHQ